MKSRKKGRKKMWIVVSIILVTIVVGALGGILADAPGRREIKELSISEERLTNLKDGIYTGEYKGTRSHMRDASVEVTIAEGQITNIKVLKGAVDKDGKELELTKGKSIKDLFDKVSKSQTLQVDVISGATLTSTAHLKALEIALQKAK